MAEVRYTFVASGHQAVTKAIGDITAAAEKNAAAVQRTRQTTQRVARQHQVQERQRKQQGINTDRQFAQNERAREAAAARASKAASKQELRSFDERLRASKKAKALEEAKTRAATTEAAKQTRAATTEAAKQAKISSNLERRKADDLRKGTERARTHLNRQSADLAKFHAVQDATAAKALDKRRTREAKALARTTADRRQAWRNFGSKALTAGILGVGMAGYVAARYTGRAIRENWDLETQAAGIASRGSMGAKRMSTGAVARQLQETAAATPGIKTTDVGAGVQAFITKIGKGKEAMGFRNIMATMASASGARAEDIGGTMADLYSKFGITKKGEMQDILSRLHVQGKTGAFELQDFAKFAPRIFSAARVFGAEKGVEGAATIGGLMQMVRGTVGSGAQAATGVENMLQTLIRKSPLIKQKFGVDVFDKEGKARKLPDILAEFAAAGKGDVKATAGIFTERGQKAMNAFLLKFKELKDEGKSSADALKLLKQAIQDSIDAPGSWEESLRDAAQAQDTANARLTAAWEGLKLSIAETAQPAIDAFAKALSDKGPAVGTALGELVAALALAAGDVLNLIDKMRPEAAEKRKRQVAIAEARKLKEETEAAIDMPVEGAAGKVPWLKAAVVATRKWSAGVAAGRLEDLIYDPSESVSKQRKQAYISGTEFQKQVATIRGGGFVAKEQAAALEARAQAGEDMLPEWAQDLVWLGKYTPSFWPKAEEDPRIKALYEKRIATTQIQQSDRGAEGDYARNLDNSAATFSRAVINAGNTLKATLESVRISGAGGLGGASVLVGDTGAVAGSAVRAFSSLFD